MRTMLAFVLLCLVASTAPAKICIVVDSGAFLDSQFVLLKSSLAPGKIAPLQGYFARFDPASATYSQFSPLNGQSVVSSAGTGALGFVVHMVEVTPNGGGGLGAGADPDVQLLCIPTSKGKLGIGDTCSGSYGGSTIPSHFITCGSSVAIP